MKCVKCIARKDCIIPRLLKSNRKLVLEDIASVYEIEPEELTECIKIEIVVTDCKKFIAED